MSTINEDPGDECPICLDPLLPDTMRCDTFKRIWEHTPCCGKKICNGCNGKMLKYNRDDTIRRMGVEKVIAKLQQGVTVEVDDSYCPLCRCPVPKSNKERFKLVLKRAKNGKAWAQRKVGSMYMAGNGVKKNEAEGARWLKKAAGAGNTDAMFTYAGCCQLGSGVPISLIDAKYWYEKASDAGDIVAQYNVGIMLFSGGPGVPADPVEAARLFRICADQGHDSSQSMLGVCFATGQGVEKNIEQAMYWYGKAVSQGNVRAMNNYADVLLDNAEEKYGTYAKAGKSPIPQALYWYRKAAAEGHEDSVTAVTELEQHVSNHCANCEVAKESCEKLLKCKKCKAAYYCGRSCQVEHWQKGHKTDCCWRGNSSVHALMQS